MEVGEAQKGKLIKIDVAEKDVNKTTIRVTYGLVVKNIGEIEGYATELVDYIPEGFKLVEDGIWEVKGNTAVTTSLKDILLQPGESTTIEITFEWTLSKDSIGSKVNKGKIVGYANPYDAEDSTPENNEDLEEMLVVIKTGKEMEVGIIIMIMELSVLFVCVLKARKMNRK